MVSGIGRFAADLNLKDNLVVSVLVLGKKEGRERVWEERQITFMKSFNS